MTGCVDSTYVLPAVLQIKSCHWKHWLSWLNVSYLRLTPCPCSCATTAPYSLYISTRSHQKNKHGNTDTNSKQHFYWKNLSPWPYFPAVIEGWITPTDSEATTKDHLWPARGTTLATDITTFHAVHSGFLCSWTSQTHFKCSASLQQLTTKQKIYSLLPLVVSTVSHAHSFTVYAPVLRYLAVVFVD